MNLSLNLTNKSVQLVCLGSASLSAAYYMTWAPNTAAAAGLGAFAFALDLVKPQLFTATAQALHEKGHRKWLALGPGALAVLLAVVSMIAVDGMILKLRSDSAGGRENVQSNWDRADVAYKKAEAELETIGAMPTVEALEAKLEGSVPVEVWRRTKQCSDVTQANSRVACQPVFDLREKIAQSKRVAKLEGERDAAKKTLDKVERPKSADPQIEAMAKAWGWSEAGVILLLTWLAGFAIEFVSCFGPALLAPAPPPPPPLPEPKPEPVLTTEQKALQWVQEMMAKSDDGKLVMLNLNSAIAKRFDVDPATVTRWRAKWVESKMLREKKDGRQITLKLARRAQA